MFWKFVTAVKMEITGSHVQALGAISCCSEHVCHVQSLSFHAHSCVTIKHPICFDKTFFIQIDLLKLQYKVMKLTVFWLIINHVKGLCVCV
jgi:hypothetical protein